MSAVRRVLITRKLPEAVLAPLRARPNLVVSVFESESEAIPRARLLEEVAKEGGVDGLLCLLSDSIDSEVIGRSNGKLKAISTLSVGYSHIALDSVLANRIRVGYTPGVLTDATADLAVTLLLSTARMVPDAASAVKDGRWKTWSPFWLTGKAVAGKTIGLIGPGRIGEAFARRMQGFGCPIKYHGKSGPKPAFEAALSGTGPVSYAPLDELLSTCDFVVLLCALTPDTRGLMTYQRLTSMKKDATLVNVSRGEVVDQEALVRVLRERPDLSAGLDVTTPEPLPPSSPLLSLPNCVVLPHIGSATEACRTEMCEIAVQNLLAGIEGQEMVAEVNETKGKFV